jgi:cysteine desulfurase
MTDTTATPVIARPVYLDYQSTTPTDPRVVDAMTPFFAVRYGNPHSTTHQYGADADRAISSARASVGDLIGATGGEIIFTSGATEANNLALFGVAEHLKTEGRTHILTSSIEHACVRAVLAHLSRNGFLVTTLDVPETGVIDPDAVDRALRSETGLVSIMAVNNEIGTVQPLRDIGRICKRRGVLFHADAAQAVGKIPIDVERCEADLLSISAHKLYGPKGIGALYVRQNVRRRMQPLVHGGGQERGLRSGTLPTPLCVGFGHACDIASVEMQDEARHILRLRDRFLELLWRECGEVRVNGALDERRIPGNLNLTFEGVDAEALVIRLRPHVAISTGSACTTTSIEPSHVLLAIGLSVEAAESSVRIGFGRFTTNNEVEQAAMRIADAVASLRAVARPLNEVTRS